jgi:hypothetical protein
VATVRYQLSGSGPKAQRVQLKTAASEKPVPLPSFVTARLLTHHAAQLRERAAVGVPTEEELVFVTPRGLPVSPSWLTQHFQGLARRRRAPEDAPPRSPAWRRDAAHRGRPPPGRTAAAPARLVEDDDREIYSHVTTAQERQAAEVLEAAVAG